MNKTIPYRKIAYANCGLETDNLKYEVVHQVNWTNDEKEKSYRISLAIDSLILFTEMGYSFAKMMTVLMMCMSIAMLFYSLFIYITAHPVAGWTTTILFLSIAFFGLFGILTIVIKYLQLLIDLIFKRKQYTFESVEKLTK
jgi:glycosyltransferase (fragment)